MKSEIDKIVFDPLKEQDISEIRKILRQTSDSFVAALLNALEEKIKKDKPLIRLSK
jgi:hypothetical protein